MTGPATTNSRRLVLVAMTLANAMILVDQTAVPLALPDVMQTFGIGTASAQWVLNASLLPLAGFARHSARWVGSPRWQALSGRPSAAS